MLGAFLEGWRRVLAAPVPTIGLLLILAFAGFTRTGGLPAGAWNPTGMRELAGHAKAGWSPEQASIFQEHVHALTQAFLDHMIRAEGLFPALVLWMLFGGGALERLARGVPIGAARFSAACRRRLLPFFRLTLVVAVAYIVLARWLRPLHFGDAYFVIVMIGLKVVVDFAVVRIVVEDRRGVIGAIAGAIRFARLRPVRVAILTLLNVLAYLIVLRLWYQAAPSTSTPAWAALLVTLLYLLLRVWTTLSFLASELVFFQGELASVDAPAMPEPLWPESPAADATSQS